MKFCPLFWQRKNPSSPWSKFAKSKPLTGTLISSFICLVSLSVCYVPFLFKLSHSRAARWSQGNLGCLFNFLIIEHFQSAALSKLKQRSGDSAGAGTHSCSDQGEMSERTAIWSRLSIRRWKDLCSACTARWMSIRFGELFNSCSPLQCK